MTVNFFGQLLTTKARHSIMLMIVSKLNQDIKQEKSQAGRLLFFTIYKSCIARKPVFCVQYICEIRRRLANRAAARFSMGGTL